MKKIPSVLIVDDLKDEIYIAKRFLKSANVCEEIFEANSGEKALELLEEKPPTLILLDINMPVMDGFEFMEEYKLRYSENEHYQNVSIIFVTSSDYGKDIDKAMSYEQVIDYCVKPFDDEAIERIWQKHYDP